MSLHDEAPDGAMILTGLDACAVGITDTCVIYSYDKLVAHFEKQFGTYEDAIDWISFNIMSLHGNFQIMKEL